MSSREDVHKLVSTAGLLLVDAMVFHEILASTHKDVPTLSQLRYSENIKRALEQSWLYILRNINYEPVFEIALNILLSLPAHPLLDAQLRKLVELAYDIAASRVLLRHDLFGRIYHRLLLGNLVKYYATYYTSIPAARLLARLLVNLPSSLDVKSVPPTYNGEPLRVVDFACGSGTLLSAVYKEIDARHRIESENPRVNELHRYLIEEGLWGFDVLHHAVHLAATVLSLHNPIPVSGSKLFVLKLGEERYMGSINFLKTRNLSQDMVLTGRAAAQEVAGVSERRASSIQLPDFHICIMNPPFTRNVVSNLLFGSLPKEERSKLQVALKQLLRELGLSGIGQAGLGAVFTFIADKYLEGGGRVGLVLPRGVLSGVAWRKVREMLLSRYHIEYIVTSYEANQWNFSENADLSEILLVARKRKNGEEPGYTIFVNLWKKPRNELESIHIGTLLVQLYNSARLYDIENSNASPYNLKLYGKKIGEVYSAKLRDAANFGVYNVFSQMELNRVAVLLRKGIIYLPDQGVVGRIPLTSLSELGAKIGPDARQVHSNFGCSREGKGTVFKAFWGYDSSLVNKISQVPNMHLQPKEGRVDQARELWEKSGKFLITMRVRLNTYPVLAVHVSEDVLSNVWWPVKLSDEIAKILALWFNSTLGFLLLVSAAEVTEGPWIEIKKGHLEGVPVLDINRLEGQKRSALLQLYDESVDGTKVSEMRFKAPPEEFKNPKARRVLDEKICEILGLKLRMDTLYKMLSEEPMLTG